MKKLYNYKVANIKASRKVPNIRIQSENKLSVKELKEAINDKYKVRTKDFIVEMFVTFDNQENPAEPAPMVPMPQTDCTVQQPENCQGTDCSQEVQCDEFGSLCNDVVRAIDNGELQPYCSNEAIDDLISNVLSSGQYTEDTCNSANGDKRHILMDVIMKHIRSLPNAFMYGFLDTNPVAQTTIYPFQ